MNPHHHSRRLLLVVFAATVAAVCAPDWLAPGTASRALAESSRSPEDEDTKAAVARGIEFLKKAHDRFNEDQRSFSIYTMMRAGVPPEDPLVDLEIQRILGRCHKEGGYSASNNNYGTAVDLMALLAARKLAATTRDGGADLYTTEIQMVLDYLISKQNSTGDWDYLASPSGQGDTSQTQFALLALWPAAEAGFKVPMRVWEGAAVWLLDTQFKDGGFSYHPRGPSDNGVEHGMTVAGVTGLAIARRFLFTSSQLAEKKAKDAPQGDSENPANPFGIEQVKTDVPEDKPAAVEAVEEPKETTTKLSAQAVQTALGRGAAWLAGKYTIMGAPRFKLYYVYGLERMAALMTFQNDRFAGNDWYADGVNQLLSLQQQDGSWQEQSGAGAGTCFAILFMTKATFKQVGRRATVAGLGGGLQQRARGLDLDKDATAEITPEGKVAAAKYTGPIDELLADILKNPNSKLVNDFADKVVETAHEGKSEELIKQKDTLKTMVVHANPEVRRTALWALGRCEDLGMVPLMIKALEDNNLDVIVEAQNALCMLSRRPRGFGLPLHPWDELPEDATDEAKQRAVQDWRSAQIDKWKKWYFRVRPYDQRDDLTDVGRL